MTYSVQLSEEAKFDVLESFRWYELQRDGLGFDFELCVEAGLNFISRHPEAIQIRYDDIRIYFIERFPYGIHYQLRNKIIHVAGILHTRKDPKDWIEKLKL